MSNPDETAVFYQRGDGAAPRLLWEYPEETQVADQPTDLRAGLVDLGFIRVALRRSVRLWGTLAVIGLLVGAAVYVLFPASHEASATVLLPPPAYSGAIQDEQIYAQSRTVAGLALSHLKSSQNAAGLTGDYTVLALTDRVLQITTKAASADQAISEANALAAALLTFQADLLKTQEQLVNATLQQQIGQAQQQISSMDSQISQLSAQATTSTQEARLNSLRGQRSQAVTVLDTLKLNATNNQVTVQIATDQALHGSQILDNAVLIAQHAKKRLLLYLGGGLLAGLVLGLGIVVIRALVSDKLHRRDEVARALGAPVKLSVGAVRLTGRSLRRHGLAAAQRPEAKKIVAHLGKAIASSSRKPASLAVISVDDVSVPAVCLVSLAVAKAQQGAGVVVADLCVGSPAGRLLGVTSPGVQRASVSGAELTVVVPEPDDPLPVGPLDSGSGPRAAEPLRTACEKADLLLTLITLDPALGGEHLTGWTRSVVAIITAGRASVSRIHAVGETVRLAGTPIFSGLLVGADRSDESLGVISAPRPGDDFVPQPDFTL